MGVSQNQNAYARFDVSAGINTRKPKQALEPNEAADILNFHILPKGGLRKRKGIQKVLSGDTGFGAPVNGLYHFRKEGVDTLIAVAGGKVYYLGGFGWQEITNEKAIDDEVPVSFATHRHNLLITDGINPPLQWDGDGGTGLADYSGTTIDTGITLDKARLVVTHRERLIFADVTVTDTGVTTRHESRLLATQAGTWDSFDTTSVGYRIDCGDGDGDSITAAISIKDTLVVFKQNSIWKVTNYGVAGVQQAKKIAEVGCPGPFAALAVGNNVFFLDREGQLWAFNIFGQDEDGLANLTLDKLGATVLDQVLKDRLPFARLVQDPAWGEVICGVAMQSGEENNMAWVHNYMTQGFTRFEWATNFCSLTSVRDTNGVRRIFGGDYSGVVYQLETSNSDDGADIDWLLITRADDMNNLALIKRLADLHVYMKVQENTDFDIEFRTDFQKSGTEYTNTAEPTGAASGPPGSGTGGTPSGDTSSTPAPTEDTTPDPPSGASNAPTEESVTADPTAGTITDYMYSATDDGEFVYLSYLRSDVSPKQLRLQKVNPKTHAISWDIVVATDNTPLNRGIAYDPDNKRVWLSAKMGVTENIYVVDTDTQAVVQTIDAAAEVVGAFVNLAGNGFERNNQMWIPFRYSGGSSPDGWIVFNADTYAYVDEHQGLGVAPVIKIGSYYWSLQSTLWIAWNPATGARVAASDHGNLAGAGYSGGTSADLRGPWGYLPGEGRVYGISDATTPASKTGWLAGADTILNHPDGTPHSPAHDYIPSGAGTNDALNFVDSIYQFLIGHPRRGELFLFSNDGGGNSFVRRITPDDSAPTIAELDTIVAQQWNFAVYVDGVIFARTTDGNFRSYA